MKIAFIFILLFSRAVLAETCSEISTEVPPFYVSDTYKQGQKVWENLRNIDNPNKIDYYLPENSIVYTPPELMENLGESDTRVPVEVLSVANEDVNDRFGKSRFYGKDKKWHGKWQLRQRSGNYKRYKRPSVGVKGYISHRSLIKVDKYKFRVRGDSRLYDSPSGVSLNNNFLALQMDGDQFKVNRCCEESHHTEDATESCYDNYIFDVLDENQKVLDSFSMDSSCSIMKDILPIPNSNFAQVSPILKMTESFQNEELGLNKVGIEDINMVMKKRRYNDKETEVALMQFPFNSQTNLGPMNSYHYNPDDSGNSDSLIKPHSACALMQVMKEFQRECKGPGCQVQLGDMYHESSWQAHAGHGSGECIDIRPFRKSDDIQKSGLDIRWHKERYSRERTQKFMELAIKAGADSVFFNDTELIKKFGNKDFRKKIRPDLSADNWTKKDAVKGRLNRYPKHMGGHNNHIHVCFSKTSRSTEVEDSCKNGIN